MIRSLTVHETTPYDEVGNLLHDALYRIQKCGYKLLNVFETKVNKIPHCKTDQGFIIVYDDTVSLAQPEQQLEPRWIPCSERLPDYEEKSYWVCTDSGNQYQVKWSESWPPLSGNLSWGWDYMDYEESASIIAWRPLPEPYKEGGKNER